MAGRHTPVMEQHARAKRAYPDAIVFFRLGDFYEMFGDDAVVAARLLDLTLTSRNKGKPDEIPMAGVPHHAAHGYIPRLLEAGHKVAICEQMADPSKTRGIVPREVVRVITPGLVIDGEHLKGPANNWLAAIEATDAGVGIALLDLSTGELSAAGLSDVTALLGELCRARPREVLVGEQAPPSGGGALAAVQAALGGVVARPDAPLDDAQIDPILEDLASEARRLSTAARRAVARCLRFARACHPGAKLPVCRIASWDPASSLIIDAIAQSHLELVESVSGAQNATLLGVIDATCTPGGARLLRRRLLAPLTEVDRIRRRLDRVELFVVHSRLRAELRSVLGAVGDLERLAMRASLGQATPRDLGALRDGLRAAAAAVALLETLDGSDRQVLGSDESIDTVADLQSTLAAALVERPPAQPKDGGVFLPGYDPELDELDTLRRTGTEQMVTLEARLREETGIGSLKVRYTRVFGWYIEVSRGQSARAPERWRRKQTVASGERYTSDELDELADRITTAEERHRERELELLRALVGAAAEQSERVRALAARLSRWDVAAGLAEVAHRFDYVRPEVNDSLCLEIEDGRHPVVERLAAAGRFVPNDVRLDAERERLWIVTGPNMAGKSTLLRQAALIAILAQMGSYVPARAARIGLIDRVLSRVGASDNLAQGESTFMVEMRETAEILRRAGSRSLVILDEIGRGTSTYDGLSIAWAVAEHLDRAIGCRALFATHYHELTALSDDSAHVANYSVSARELDGDVIFLHRLVPGAASRSYGVAVAKLAGLPESVLSRARALLELLEAGNNPVAGNDSGSGRQKAGRGKAAAQLDLFRQVPDSPVHQEVIATLQRTDVDRLTPIDALTLLAKLKARLDG